MMATYEEKDKRKVSDLIKQGHVIDIKKEENGEPYIVLDDTVLGLDHRVKQFLKDQLINSNKLSDFDIKQLIYKCCVKSLRKINEDGTPEIIGVDPKTGKPIYSDWMDCFCLDVPKKNVVAALNVTLLDDYDKTTVNLIEKYVDLEPYKRRNYSHNRFDNGVDRRDHVYGEQEDWGPETF